MSQALERRWDDAVETAWREFRQRLADHVAGLGPEESIVVAYSRGSETGLAPYCLVLCGADGDLWVEAVSNVHLGDEWLLSEQDEALLEELGWNQPDGEEESEGSTNFWAEIPQREADRVAVMVVRALREAYAVIHPIYLDAEGLEPEPMPRPLPPKPKRGPESVRRPSSVDEVRQLIDDALGSVWVDPPEWDEDGDLPLPVETEFAWLSVHHEVPRVLITYLVVDGVLDEHAALAEINRLNLANAGVTFALAGSGITVTREFSVAVATPTQVRTEIAAVLGRLEGWVAEFTPLTQPPSDDGEPSVELDRADQTDEPSRRGSRFEAAYAVMSELERDERRSVGPAAMARIFDHDPRLLLKAIRLTEKQRRETRLRMKKARKRGSFAREVMARARHDYLRDLVAVQRAGLRLIVDGPIRQVQIDQLALFDEDEAGSPR